MVPEITPFVNGFSENATSLCPKELVQTILLRKRVKDAREISRPQPTADIDKIFKKKLNKSSNNTRNQNTRDFIKRVTFVIVHIPETNVQLMEKFVMFAIKRTISKFAAHMLVRKYMKLKRKNLMNPLTRTIINF